jgi:hypothetical protein
MLDQPPHLAPILDQLFIRPSYDETRLEQREDE